MVVGIVTFVSPKTLTSANVPTNEEPTSTKSNATANATSKAGLIVKANAELMAIAAPSPMIGVFGVASIA